MSASRDRVAQRRARIERVVALHREGLSVPDIALRLALGKETVRGMLHAGGEKARGTKEGMWS